MLTNYDTINPLTSVSAFLKEMNQKKNMHHIILDTEPKTFIDAKTIALKIHEPNEKLQQLKKTIPYTKEIEIKKLVDFLIVSGEELIETPQGVFSFMDALEYLLKSEHKILSLKLKNISPKEIYALETKDTIGTAKQFFLQKKAEILPVIENLKLIGEVRPIDLLSSELHEKGNNNKDFYSQNKENSLFSLSVENIMNQKPHTLKQTETIKDAIKYFLHKKLPSLLIVEGDEIYSIVTIKDIFNQYRKMMQESQYNIEIVGEDKFFEDERKLIRGFALKFMKKNVKNDEFDSLKINFKIHGNKEAGHQRKGEMKVTLSKGPSTIQVEKDISTGTSDEVFNDKIKGKWNIPKMFQNLLKALETRIAAEKRKGN